MKMSPESSATIEASPTTSTATVPPEPSQMPTVPASVDQAVKAAVKQPVVDAERRPVSAILTQARELAAADDVAPDETPDAPVKERVDEPVKAKKEVPDWHLYSEPSGVRWRNPWWLLWFAYAKLGLHRFQWIHIPHHWGSLKARTLENKNRIWELGSSVAGVYAEVSVTGGVGKTTQTTWHAAEMQHCSDAHVLVIDSDSGAIGKASIRYQVNMREEKYNITNVFDLILNGRWEPNYDMLYRCLPRHKESGVRLLSTDSEIAFTAAQTMKGVQKLRPAFSVIFIDTTPGTKEPITHGARSEATVISIPLLFQSQELEHDIHTTRQHMNANNGEFDRRLAEGSLFISVSDVPKHKFNRRTQYELAERLGVPFSQVLLFPSDKHLFSKGVVTRSAVTKRYEYALRESVRVRAEAATRHNERHPLPLPEPLAKETPERQIARMSKSLVLLCGTPKSAAAEVLKSAQKIT